MLPIFQVLGGGRYDEDTSAYEIRATQNQCTVKIGGKIKGSENSEAGLTSIHPTSFFIHTLQEGAGP